MNAVHSNLCIYSLKTKTNIERVKKTKKERRTGEKCKDRKKTKREKDKGRKQWNKRKQKRNRQTNKERKHTYRKGQK